MGQGRDAVKAGSLFFEVRTSSLDGGFQACATVKDGLASIAGAVHPAAEAKGCADNEKAVREFRLIGDPGIFSLALPGERHASVCEEALSLASLPGIRWLNLKIGGAGASEAFLNLAPDMKDGTRFLVQTPSVQIAKSVILRLPHTRKSVPVETLGDSECKSFLREAEALKGVRADCAELLAVFRHVPIEVISRLRFVADEKVLRYSIVSGPVPTSTRVHDMAAVRDASSREVVLIPHRAQFRAVLLN
jgi:hypothetical protein